VKARPDGYPGATVSDGRLIKSEQGDAVHGGARLAAGALVAALLATTMTACRGKGDLAISNDGPGDVTVLIEGQEVVVPSSGGATLLNYGCTPGDVTVRFASGRAVVLPGPVCPDQRIAVRDGTAVLRPASESGA
jgi:hypothetical protein